jgi:integrase
MGRRRQGWKLRPPREGRTTWTVRWWTGARQVERSTGETDRRRASETAARLYAAEVQYPTEPAHRGRAGGATGEAAAQWLASLSGAKADTTIAIWQVYARAFVEWFPTLADLTTARAAEFVSERLRQVRAATVRKESTALRSFISWLQQQRWIGWEATVPPVPRGALGTPYPRRRRAKPKGISPAEIKRLLRSLPEWSRMLHGEQWPVRARFVVAYQTGLRPSTLDRLSVPEHYRRGARELEITEDIDKARWARAVPLTPEARKALDRICPRAGLIFGKHDYREVLHAAAVKVLDEHRAKTFCGAHLRSARATHLCERTQNLAGVQFLLGHLQISTTAGYVQPSRRAAEQALADSSEQGRVRKY